MNTKTVQSRSMQDVGRCLACQHWQGRLSEEYTPERVEDDWLTGKCKRIQQVVDCEVRAGWDGGYVDYIETPANFGCNQWEPKAPTESSSGTGSAERCPNCGALEWYQMFNVRCCFRCATASCVGSGKPASDSRSATGSADEPRKP